MRLNASEVSKLIEERISNFNLSFEVYDQGRIVSVSDGIIQIYGIKNVMQGEVLEIIEKKKYAIALNLEKNIVGAVVLGSYININEGMHVKCTGKMLEIPVGKKFLGRVVNALGKAIDGKGSIKSKIRYPVENSAPGVIDRKTINQPIQTGYKCIDAMIPIGKGQRELIIGDRQTGKTALAIDTIINQKFSGVKCVYVAIGQKSSTIYNVVQKLEENNALSYTVIVVASASEPASLQFIAPYAGCAIGEYFRDRGEHVLVVYDDLSKHAIAYRQISLLLRRPPGREAFPGDVFYLHSRLLERSACVNETYVSFVSKNKVQHKEGSLTALPIVETQEGDVSAFVPTNIISITDGQIFLETGLFNSGIRPAVNPGISVSRVGNIAQTEIMRKLSSGIRTALAQYRELASFSQFVSDLDKISRNQLLYGEKLTELLKQKQYSPISVAEQSLILFAAEQGFLEDVKLEKVLAFEEKLLNYFQLYYYKEMQKINSSGLYTKKVIILFESIMKNFLKHQFFRI